MAITFPNFSSIVETRRRLRLKNVELVLIWGDKQTDYDIALPLSDVADEKPQLEPPPAQVSTPETKTPPPPK